jgi:hypothetical protein
MSRNPVTLMLALLAVLRAAVRVLVLERSLALPDLVARLRRTRPDFLAEIDPLLVLGVTEALLPFLPPYRAGRCVKRSLLLLDLWSRAGLAPSLHLGIRAASRNGHAWITTGTGGASTFRPPDVSEAWRA